MFQDHLRQAQSVLGRLQPGLRKKANTVPKEGAANATVAGVAASFSAEDYVERIKYECYQHPMSAMGELDIGIIQVGHSDTGVV